MSGTDTWALPYQRLPLEQSKKEVRLIEFHFEGAGDDFFTRVIDIDEEAKRPLSLRMVKASLLEPPKFRALSYVWGPSKEGRCITLQVPQKAGLKGESIEDTTAVAEEETLESCEIEVTDNLFSALVHYRTMKSADQQTYFWIDALCINQRDNDEKSWQVAMMRDVYSSAHMVHAWMGTYPERVYFRPGELINVFAALSREGLARFGYRAWRPLDILGTAADLRFIEMDIIEWVRGIKLVQGPFSRANGDGTYEISMLALVGFSELAFWCRVWILQELVLANEILFTCSTWCISSETLFTALRIIIKAMQVADSCDPLSSTQGTDNVLPSEKQWIRAKDTQQISICPMLDFRHDRDGKKELWDLIDWNAVSGGLQASMPADHVFGLFGIATDVEELGIRLDYSRDVADIYIELASSCIKKRGLVVITHVQWPKKVAKLPSWVPDWSALSSTKTLASILRSHAPLLPSFLKILSKPGVGKYAGPRAYRFTVSSAGLPALVVGGNTLTTVQSFLPAMWNARTETLSLIRRIWSIQAKLLAAKDMIEQSATAYRTVEDRHKAFASTIFAGGWESGRGSFENQWSLNKLFEGYRLLLDPVSAETSLNALWRRESPSREMKLHSFYACWEIAETFMDKENSYPPVIDSIPIAEFCRHPGLYYRIYFDDYADSVLGNLVNVEGAKDTMTSIEAFLKRVKEVGKGRRPFLSTDGYLGLGPAEMQKGDVVAYLDGAEMPSILRPLSTGGFTLVGEAYVYGLMFRDADMDDDTDGLNIIGIFPSSRLFPEIGTAIHPCPKGERREFVIV
ncbi:Heterokaryon incompatibility protein 6 [Diaporthe amygdali]|uniref:Heterokaryon incompatibility protein 6 n=1 Tax=Phomopsis amygdali TaxID=1214568 RepID=UPI0022FDDFC6|nr:Heterokaryon incompatibility protein 6 [Diaporthe amygdali]KAJ0117518.1 Heterokaryon incompatibility protein 6 [Diaporthe amygdali]